MQLLLVSLIRATNFLKYPRTETAETTGKILGGINNRTSSQSKTYLVLRSAMRTIRVDEEASHGYVFVTYRLRKLVRAYTAVKTDPPPRN